MNDIITPETLLQRIVIALKFGSEGATTTSTSYVTIADSDIAFDPQKIKKAMPNRKLYAKFIYHLKNDTDGEKTYARIYRQNAGTPVDGSEVSVTGAGWGIVETDWIDFSDESEESYQVQMYVTGGVGEYNSIIMLLTNIKF